MTDFFLRPVESSDLDALYTLALSAQWGMTSLPKDKTFLKDKIEHSIHAFQQAENERHEEWYVWVLVETSTQKVIGTCGILDQVGLKTPFYSYKLIHHNTPPLTTLEWETQHQGPTELGGLMILPEYRKLKLGRFLSLARLVVIASFPKRFETHLIAEMRGISDSDGNSPFWGQTGQKTSGLTFAQADFETAKHSWEPQNRLNTFINISQLDEITQNLIGKTHPDTKAAQQLLESEGFRWKGLLDILDAGPKLEAKISELKTIRNTHTKKISHVLSQELFNSVYHPKKDGNKMILFNARFPDAKLACSPIIQVDKKHIGISEKDAECLGVTIGSTINLAPLHTHTFLDRFKEIGKWVMNLSHSKA